MKTKHKIDKEELLKLLDDEEIQNKIKNFLNKEDKTDEIEELKSLLEKKEEEIKMLKKFIENLKSKICEKDKKIEKINNENNQNLSNLQNIKEENQTLKDKLNFYESNFKEELKAYEIFQSLSNETKQYLSNIFKDESLKGFLACGVQEKNIDSLWEFIKYKINEGQNEDLEKLKNIFDFFFDRFVIAKPIYKRDEVKEKEFDPKKHINATPFNPSGEIEEILFRGYINTKKNEIIKKSIVKVK